MFADLTLHIHPKALAILALLSGYEPDFAEFENGHYVCRSVTSAWYNGRERGVCLQFAKSLAGGPVLCMTFGEIRGSDGLFVDFWVSSRGYLNPPVLEDCPHAAYDNRKEFPCDSIAKAKDFITSLCKAFYKEGGEKFCAKRGRKIDEGRS